MAHRLACLWCVGQGSAAPSARRRGRLFALLALLLLALVPTRPAAADAGPKPRLAVHVTYEGRPIEGPFQARMLTCAPPGAEPYIDGPRLPGLDRLDLTDPSGCRWQEPSARVWGGECADGECEFGYMLPERFRLAIYLPGEGRLYVTDVAERQGLYDRFEADLSPDGTGHLRRDSAMARNWTLRGMALALFLTLVLEAVIVLLYAWWRRLPRRRLLGVSLVANALTLPTVWLLAGLAAAIGGPGAGVGALVALEVVAWLAEGALYAGWAKLALGAAFLLSLVANAASVGLGLLVY